MKTIASSVMAVVLVVGLTPAFGGDKDLAGVPQYNPKTEIEFRGTIAKMSEVPQGNAYAGVHLTVQTTKSETFEIYLGPSDFIKLVGMPLHQGLKDVTIVGSKVKFEGNDLVLARELRVEKTVLSLRDEKGFPNWLWLTRTGITSGL
jgi:hypothetical protein